MGRWFPQLWSQKKLDCRSILYGSWPSATEEVKISSNHRATEKIIMEWGIISQRLCIIPIWPTKKQTTEITGLLFLSFFFFFLSINHTCCTKNDRNWNSWFSICCLCDLAIRRRLERISPYHSQGTSTASHASTVQRFHHAPAICNIHIIQTWEKLQEADQIQIISWTADALTCSQRWKS